MSQDETRSVMSGGRVERQIRKMEEWDSEDRPTDYGDPKERNLKYALSEIQRMGEALEMSTPSIKIAKELYKEALDRNRIRGRSIEGVASACLYISGLQNNEPRNLHELGEVSRVDKKEITSTYQSLMSELGLENVTPPNPRDHVDRYVSQLKERHATDPDRELQTDEFYVQLRSRANEILDVAEEAGLFSGKTSSGLAAAAIYASAVTLFGDDAEGVRQSDLADISKVSEVTIRFRYQESLEEWRKQTE